MKNIRLDDEAYELLKSWKRTDQDSFSAIIKSVVPKCGTLGAMLNYVNSRHSADPEIDRTLEVVMNNHDTVKEDPWALQ